MIINHNIAALNTHRQLSSATSAQSKSMEKLASGMRINKAGDDAAGLAISEKMRGQIRGLDMASKNAQDGISLIATAEGALNETHDILQRMRELAVQAGNDTNVDTDRNEIQKEINQLTSEVNRIGNTTEFNTKKLVNGDLSSKFEVSPAVTTTPTKVTQVLAKDSTVKVGVDPITWTNGASAKFDFNVAGAADNGLAWNALDTSKPNDIKVTRDAANSFTVDVRATDGSANTLTVDAEAVAFDPANNTYSYDSQGVSFSFKQEDLADWAVGESVTIDLNTVAAAGTNGTGTHTSVADKQQFTNTAAGTPGPATDSVMTNITVAGSQLEGLNEVKVDYDESTKKLTVLLNDSTNTKTLSKYEFSVDAGAAVNFDADGVSFKFTAGTASTSTDATASGTFKLESESKETTTATSITTPAVVEDRSASFQIGANQNQSMSVGINDMRAAALGLTGTGAEFTAIKDVTNGTNSTAVESAVDVSTHSNAAKAVTTINKAIETVSAERSKLGANQNRLEHTINNLGTSSENLTAAESRIRDVDMAKEMMTQTKNSILSQAAQAMLAQANQQPQGVLQLLR
ncbi:flagellin [Peribacillus sp. NPDC097675]|uniref:flagellin N-terminal helical domain-containing protein n=1 Tax=Peribacillus sp. NPDC097675 TaxID=3390618 RepID=UPI003D08AC14